MPTPKVNSWLGLRIFTVNRKPPREGFENHHQEQPGTTLQSLEEPRRIIYTYQGGSYKV
jgi:hypothetical protein